MMKCKKIVIIISLVLLLLAGVLITVYIVTKKHEDNNSIEFYLPCSASYASNWDYDISNTGIIKEADRDCYGYILMDYDYFKFEAKQSGEVTIYFIARYETEVVEENCFSITYYVDENGNVTEVSSENKPGKINFDDDIVGLITLKIVDGIKEICIFIFGVICEVIEMFDFQSMNQ